MNEFAKLDPNFKIIVDYLDNKQITLLELSKALQAFRKSICLNWYSQFLQYNHISFLTAIWNSLFQLVTNEDPGIRISTFSTLGALMFALSPFIPRTTVISFLSSVQDQQPNPHLSIAIVACFCHISKFVSPLYVESFLSQLPIIQHFGNELEDYLKYLPKIFSSMDNLDTEFLRVLLRTLLINFGKSPTISFVLSVVELLRHEPEILIPDLMLYINHKSLQLSLLMISPIILHDSQLSKFFDDKSKEELFSLAITTLSQPNPSFSEFEEACRTLVALLDSTSNKDTQTKLKTINSILNKDLPPHLMFFSLQLSDSLEKLRPCDSDSPTIKTSKISALSKFLIRLPTEANFIEILSIFRSFLESKGEIFSKLVDSVAKCFTVITLDLLKSFDYKDNTCSIIQNLKILLSKFLEINSTNWVQNKAVIKLIRFVKRDVGNYLINNYEEKAIKMIFKFCFSRQIPLSSAAASVMASTIRSSTSHILVHLLINKADFLDDFSLLKILNVLNLVIDGIGPKPFMCLEAIIVESVLMNKSIQTASEAFLFLNKIKSTHRSNDLKKVCFDLIGRIFQSFTGIDPQLPTTESSLKPISELVETDILSRPFDEQTYFMKTIQQCLKYLNRNKITDKKLAELAIRLVKLFPEESLEILKEGDSSYINYESFFVLILDIVHSTPSLPIASRCVAAVSSQATSNSQLCKIISDFIKLKLIKNGRDKYHFSLYLQAAKDSDRNDSNSIPSENAENENNLIESIINKLNEIVLNPHEEMLYQFLTSSDKIGLIKSTDFDKWPLNDEEFCSFVEENSTYLIQKSIECELTESHVKFISLHRNLFDHEIILKIKKNYSIFYQKLFEKEEERHLNFDFNSSNIVKISSISPLIHTNSEIISSTILIHNFFLFHKCKIHESIFNNILSKLLLLLFDKSNDEEKTERIQSIIKEAIDYANKYKIKIEENSIEKLFEFSFFKLSLAKYCYSLELDRLSKFSRQSISISDLLPKESIIDAYIQSDPVKYFRQFTQKFTFKSRNLKCLIYFLSRFDIPGNLLSDFLSDELLNIPLITSFKHILYFFRLIAHFLFNVYSNAVSNKNHEDISYIMKLFNSLTENLIILCQSNNAAIHREVGLIYSWLPLFVKPNESFIKYINTCTHDFGNLSYFFAPSALSVIMGNIKTNCLTNDSLIHAAKSNVPSEILRVLRSIHIFLKPNHVKILNELYSSMYPSVVEVFRSFNGNPLIDNYLEKITKEISLHHEFYALQKLLFSDLTYYAKQKNATNLLSILNRTKIEFTKEFATNPNIENGIKMFNSPDCPKNNEFALMIIGKAAAKPCLLASIVLINKLLNRINEEERENTIQVVSALIDSLQMGERGDILKKSLTLNNEDVWTAALNAAQMDSKFENFDN
ncbi:hypothetical protein TRFO_05262 [Tritrichomonas foetus]|uniref:Uncharacterized protein n=1 Tax=Tritrichomonas foetus TaxID=1144522 RepID=A0A1J4KBK3_9EUKA|nr:hypothetical protein TRFO_05262 [Tritrichomonas foetus]|eukprot:OHT07068.1 hypothetical protein TRFO_05262 [Tritrichomonas foetus]